MRKHSVQQGANLKRMVVAWWIWVVLFSFPVLPSFGQDHPPAQKEAGERKIVSFFWREGCGHCKEEKKFLAALQRVEPRLELQGFNIDEPADRRLFDAFTRRFDLPKVTPITIIGGKFLIGFEKPETTGLEIERLLKEERAGLPLQQLLTEAGAQKEGAGATCPISGPATACESGLAEFRYLDVPVLGRVDLVQYTLPTLSVVLGFVDGFNPCAMWVLVAFLTALAQVGSAKKMFQFAGVFILAETLMYFLILNSWFLAFDFIRADRIVTPLVGVLAIGGAIFFFYEFCRFDGTCKVSGFEKRSQTISLINNLSRRKFTPVVILGILGIAFSVNVVEFACSIGIPQAYTKILDLNGVGFLKRELLMAIYILFYMVDDLIVFGLAIWSIEKIGLTTRYSRACNLLGSVIMLFLGLLLLLAPERLRF